jgi:ferric-dicitrate binding protein FerR (iron transport regulator)
MSVKSSLRPRQRSNSSPSATAPPRAIPDHIQSEADSHLIDLVTAEDTSTLLPGLQAWLQADPVHRAAYARSERAWRLAGPILRAANPDAGCEVLEALREAFEAERLRSNNASSDV